jgi:hypothetical protein
MEEYRSDLKYCLENDLKPLTLTTIGCTIDTDSKTSQGETKMLEQTKRAIDNLKACGLDRKDFRVRVTYTKVGEYGDLQITIFRRTIEIVPLTEKLAQHFSVDQYIENGQVRSMFIHEGKPGLHKIDLSKENYLVVSKEVSSGKDED